MAARLPGVATVQDRTRAPVLQGCHTASVSPGSSHHLAQGIDLVRASSGEQSKAKKPPPTRAGSWQGQVARFKCVLNQRLDIGEAVK